MLSSRKQEIKDAILWTLILIGMVLTAYVTSKAETLDQCIQVCKDKYPSTLPEATKIFPDLIVFEETTTNGIGIYKGTAAAIFTTAWEGKISAVTMNGEVGYHAASYKGRPVFRFLKVGGAYSRPLIFTIETSSGVYAYTMGAATSDPSSSGESYKFDLSKSKDGYLTVRTSRVGHGYGKSLKFTYQNGFSITVPDSTQRLAYQGRAFIYRDGGGTSTNDQNYTSHGGMGVWTTLAGKSTYVIMDVIK